jgi:hypothetical protein
MTENDLRVQIILSINGALIGNISGHVRAICLNWHLNDWLTVRFYLDIDPDDIEKELVSVILTEFESNLNSSNIHFHKFLDEIIYTKEPFKQLDQLKVTVFWRNEFQVLN